MTDEQAILDAVQRLPDSASFDDIAEELRIIASVRQGRADVSAGRVKSQEEAEQVLESWASKWATK